MATETDKSDPNNGKIEVSGKGWRAYVPIAVVVAALSNSGSFVGCSKQDEMMRKLDGIERKVDKQNDKVNSIDVRVARIEGAKGAPSQ